MSFKNWSAAGDTLLDGSEVSDITDGRLPVGVTLDVDEFICVLGTTWREDEEPAIAIDSGGPLISVAGGRVTGPCDCNQCVSSLATCDNSSWLVWGFIGSGGERLDSLLEGQPVGCSLLL